MLRLPSADLDRYLALRDYLRSVPAACRYGETKPCLAAEFYRDRRAYVAAKTAIITVTSKGANTPGPPAIRG